MPFLHCSFNSAVLGKIVDMNVILPENPPEENAPWPPVSRKKYPVVFLLHGLSDNYSAWCRFTSIELYARRCGTAVVMPDGGRGFYTDAVEGERYWTFVSEELPAVCASLFPISLKQKECFAAGLSMGGYGALKLALHHPERFGAVGALSPLVDIASRWKRKDTSSWRAEMKRIFGSPAELTARGNDLVALAKARIAEGKTLCPILSFCGTEDFMREDNEKFDAAMAKIAGDKFHAYWRPGGHEWPLWDRSIQEVFTFFFQHKLPRQE